MSKYLFILLLFTTFWTNGQKYSSSDYLTELQHKRENRTFQYLSIETAQQASNPNAVYEIFLENRYATLLTFPKALLKFKNLQVLIIENSNFQTIPNEISQLKALQILVLSNGKLKTLPESLGSLSKLVHLDVSYNQLSALPESVGKLKNLQFLELSHNPFKHFYLSLLQSAPLNWIGWNGNDCKLIPATIGQDIMKVSSDCDAYPYLEKLLRGQEKINKQYLDNLVIKKERYDFQFLSVESALRYPNPDKVYELYLDDKYNQLATFPTAILKFKNLQVLIIKDAKLSSIPTEIARLKALKILDIQFTKIKTLPSSLNNLSKLVYLNVSHNALQTIPTLSNLKALETLEMNHNPMVQFPSAILPLPKLSTIGWNGNSCKLIPKQIGADIMRISSDCDAYPFLAKFISQK